MKVLSKRLALLAVISSLTVGASSAEALTVGMPLPVTLVGSAKAAVINQMYFFVPDNVRGYNYLAPFDGHITKVRFQAGQIVVGNYFKIKVVHPLSGDSSSYRGIVTAESNPISLTQPNQVNSFSNLDIPVQEGDFVAIALLASLNVEGVTMETATGSDSIYAVANDVENGQTATFPNVTSPGSHFVAFNVNVEPNSTSSAGPTDPGSGSAGSSGDTTAPIPSFLLPANKQTYSSKILRNLSGKSDADTAKVELALQRLVKIRRGDRTVIRCATYLDDNARLGRKLSNCSKTQFFPAEGGDSWSYKLRNRLHRGTYRIFARATDLNGNTTGTFAFGANREIFKVTAPAAARSSS